MKRWMAASGEYARIRGLLLKEFDPSTSAAYLRTLSSLRTEMEEVNEWVRHESRGEHKSMEDATELLAAAGPGSSNGVARSPSASGAVGAVPSPSTETPPDDHAARHQLVIRFCVEGPPRAGSTTVMTQLCEQFRSTMHFATSANGTLEVAWFAFEAGIFEGQRIRFEVLSLGGAVDKATKRLTRSLVDAIIIVVDSTQSEMLRSHRYIGELLDSHQAEPVERRPELTIFAHKADAPGALHADLVAAELLVESSISVVSTTRDRRGFLYAFAIATGGAVKRVQRRDAAGLPRTGRSTFQQLLIAMGEGREAFVVTAGSEIAGSEHPAGPGPGAGGPVDEPGPSTWADLASTRDPDLPIMPQRPHAPEVGEASSTSGDTRRESVTVPVAIEEPAGTKGCAPDPDVQTARREPSGRRASALRRLIGALRGVSPAEGPGPDEE